MVDPIPVRERVRQQAYVIGFNAVGFTHATLDNQSINNLSLFLSSGRHGEMHWMEKGRRTPHALWQEATSAIVLGLNYASKDYTATFSAYSTSGAISLHARNKDYHSIMKAKLRSLGRWIQNEFSVETRIFVDTSPLMEKPLAQAAGIGWQGLHTNLVSRRFGSWLFLGIILTSLSLLPDSAHPICCGTCHLCCSVCPTGAISGDGRIDARLCISYLTIEHKSHIPLALRPLIGNWVYGCDQCLAACPWNHFATPTTISDFQSNPDLIEPSLSELATLNTDTFSSRFHHSPIKRIGRDRFVRNVLIAIGNSRIPALAKVAIAHLTDQSTLVRGAAVWALSCLLDKEQIISVSHYYRLEETDENVRTEWNDAIKRES